MASTRRPRTEKCRFCGCTQRRACRVEHSLDGEVTSCYWIDRKKNGVLQPKVRSEIYGGEEKVTAIVKTLPTRFARGELDRFFGTEEKPCFTVYFFTLGRGRPQKTEPADPYLDCPAWRGIHQLYFSHRGILIGHFSVLCIVQNVGQLPLLTTLDGRPSEWQIKPDRWVAVCTPPFRRLDETLFHEGFRGWRYFDLDAHRGSTGAKVRI